MSDLTVILSCEHATNRVPESLAGLFAGEQAILDSHRGFDPGAIELAERLARKLGVPVERSQVTRLVVDLNRSEYHPALFSKATRSLHPESRQALLDKYYRPFRNLILRQVQAATQGLGRAVHLSIHTFTPELDGKIRRADVGLLYDPSRERERHLAHRWKEILEQLEPELVVRLNYPYRGTSDAHVTALRSRFDGDHYLGLELEVNQRYVFGSREAWRHLQANIVQSFGELIAEQKSG
ncbi:MAG: N-formylglutamate amidohydrolase [Acidobacteriota bacterium]|jgi:predicted N-formylglutamate amidohydrolase